MLDIILYIIIFVVVIVLLSLFMYFTYDYMSYKEDITKNFDKSTNYINSNFSSITKSVNETNKKIDDKYYAVTQGLSNAIQIEKATSLNNYNQNNSNLFSFDNVMKKYFTFDGNSTGNLNEALYNYRFGSITPNLNLITTVNAINGMTIKTNPAINNSSNLRICDNGSVPNCINMNLYDGNFNITPENTNINKIVMNTNAGNPLASFEFSTNSIYLGSADDTAPLFINNCNLYIKNIKMIKDPKVSYTNSIVTNNYSDFNTGGYANDLQNIISYYNVNYTKVESTTAPSEITTLTYNIISNSEIINENNKGIQFTFNEVVQGSGQIGGVYSTYFSRAHIKDKTITLTLANTIPAKLSVKVVINNGIVLADPQITTANNIAYGKIVTVNPDNGEPVV